MRSKSASPWTLKIKLRPWRSLCWSGLLARGWGRVSCPPRRYRMAAPTRGPSIVATRDECRASSISIRSGSTFNKYECRCISRYHSSADLILTPLQADNISSCNTSSRAVPTFERWTEWITIGTVRTVVISTYTIDVHERLLRDKLKSAITRKFHLWIRIHKIQYLFASEQEIYDGRRTVGHYMMDSN